MTDSATEPHDHSKHPECWSCGAQRKDPVFCGTCKKIQAAFRDSNLFELLGLPKAMHVDRKALDKAFRDLSWKIHPDRFGKASSLERRIALENTTVLNDAYRTLKAPQARAEYLMSLEGIEVASEQARTQDPGFLMEMLELQEQVDALDDHDALEGFRQQTLERRDRMMAVVAAYFDDQQGTQQQAAATLSELRYINRILERIEQRLEEAN